MGKINESVVKETLYFRLWHPAYRASMKNIIDFLNYLPIVSLKLLEAEEKKRKSQVYPDDVQVSFTTKTPKVLQPGD